MLPIIFIFIFISLPLRCVAAGHSVRVRASRCAVDWLASAVCSYLCLAMKEGSCIFMYEYSMTLLEVVGGCSG